MESIAMSSTLLVVSVALFALAMPLLAYIMLSERMWNLHKVWDLALSGHKLSRWYTVIIVLSFVLAVAACLLAVADNRAQKPKGAAADELSPRPIALGRSPDRITI